MSNYDVVKKILGKINPQGETRIDEERLANLEETISIVQLLLIDIKEVSEYAERQEHSMRESGIRAKKGIVSFLEILEDEP